MRSQQNLRDALFGWASSNAQLTGRIKELALAEADDAGAASPERRAALDAIADALTVVRSARASVARAYLDLQVEVPDAFNADPSM